MKPWKPLLAALALALLAVPATLHAEDVDTSPNFCPTGQAEGPEGTHFERSEQGRVLKINRETCYRILSQDFDDVVSFTFPAISPTVTDIDSEFFATQEELSVDCNIESKQECTEVDDMIRATEDPRELQPGVTSYRVEIDFDDLMQSVDPDKHNAVPILTPEDCYPPELREGSATNNGGGDAGADAGMDSGTTDAGMDVGATDTGTTDTGTTDAGTTDTGTTDTGTTDTGTTDTGTTDTGTTDTGTTDTGTTDTGTTDTGTTDTGGNTGSGEQIGFHNQYFIRLFLEGQVGDETQTEVSDVVFEIDSESAAAPEEVLEVAAFDEQITITWRQNRLQDVENHRAFVATKDFRNMSLRQILDDDEIQNSSLGTGSLEPDDGIYEESVDVDKLTLREGDRVWVAVVSEDDVKNLSKPVFHDEAVPVVPVIDFWENYKGAGGQQTGCSTSGGHPTTLAVVFLALIGLVSIRRRRD
jgi:uncharacterized protein (TIGR03382 family)